MTSMDLEVQDPAELEKLLLEGPEVEILEDPVEVQRALLRRIFEAETPEALSAMVEATPWQDRLDEVFEVHDVRVRKSDFADGAKVYALVDAYDFREATRITLTCGGMNVVAALMQAKRKGWLPHRWRLQAKDTAQGFTVLWLTDKGVAQDGAPAVEDDNPL